MSPEISPKQPPLFFKLFLNLLQYCFCSYVLAFWLWGLRDLSFSVQFSLVTQSCPTFCDPTMPGHALQASLSITNSQRPSKPISIESVIASSHLILSSPSPPALNLPQHQGLFQWISSSHQVAKVLEFMKLEMGVGGGWGNEWQTHTSTILLFTRCSVEHWRSLAAC